MNLLQIKETCLYIHDLEAAIAFYRDRLGLELMSHVPHKHAFFRVGRSVLLIFNPLDSARKTSPPPHDGQGRYHLAFEVPADEYAAHRLALQAKGIELVDEVTWQNGQRSSYFRDPFGHVLEIVPEGVWDY